MRRRDFLKYAAFGTIRLNAGRGDLTLRAVDIPGRAVMDVRYVVLALLDTRGTTGVVRQAGRCAVRATG